MPKIRVVHELKRRSVRLPGYDYSAPRLYFVTTCIEGRLNLLGQVRDSRMNPSTGGEIATRALAELPLRYSTVRVDRFAIMPNHVHAVFEVLPQDGMCTTLARIVQSFKATTGKRYRECVTNGLCSPYRGTLWQRNYFEHVIRDSGELEMIRDYIVRNPVRWELDRENPQRTAIDPFDAWLDSLGDQGSGKS